jgi:hypothetical protein
MSREALRERIDFTEASMARIILVTPSQFTLNQNSERKGKDLIVKDNAFVERRRYLFLIKIKKSTTAFSPFLIFDSYFDFDFDFDFRNPNYISMYIVFHNQQLFYT